MFVLVPTGNPPSLRFGHPDVTTDDTAPPEATSGCRPGRSPQRSKERTERPGAAGAPAGAEEGYSVPTHPAL